jgi:hypothetical protein
MRRWPHVLSVIKWTQHTERAKCGGSHDHSSSFEPDRIARRDRDILDDGDGQQSFGLQVAQERDSDFWRQLGQLHHISGHHG